MCLLSNPHGFHMSKIIVSVQNILTDRYYTTNQTWIKLHEQPVGTQSSCLNLIEYQLYHKCKMDLETWKSLSIHQPQWVIQNLLQVESPSLPKHILFSNKMDGFRNHWPLSQHDATSVVAPVLWSVSLKCGHHGTRNFPSQFWKLCSSSSSYIWHWGHHA